MFYPLGRFERLKTVLMGANIPHACIPGLVRQKRARRFPQFELKVGELGFPIHFVCVSAALYHRGTRPPFFPLRWRRSIFSQSAEKPQEQRRMASRTAQLFTLFFDARITHLSHGKFFRGFKRAKSSQETQTVKKIFCRWSSRGSRSAGLIGHSHGGQIFDGHGHVHDNRRKSWAVTGKRVTIVLVGWLAYSAFSFFFPKLCLILKNRFLAWLSSNFQERLLMKYFMPQFIFGVSIFSLRA